MIKINIAVEGNNIIDMGTYNISLGVTTFSASFYGKVVVISGNKEGIDINVMFTSIDSKDEATFFKQYSFIPTLESNFIAQAYEYLKTLDEYSDAVDC